MKGKGGDVLKETKIFLSPHIGGFPLPRPPVPIKRTCQFQLWPPHLPLSGEFSLSRQPPTLGWLPRGKLGTQWRCGSALNPLLVHLLWRREHWCRYMWEVNVAATCRSHSFFYKVTGWTYLLYFSSFWVQIGRGYLFTDSAMIPMADLNIKLEC